MLGSGQSSTKCRPDGLDNYESIAKPVTCDSQLESKCRSMVYGDVVVVESASLRATISSNPERHPTPVRGHTTGRWQNHGVVPMLTRLASCDEGVLRRKDPPCAITLRKNVLQVSSYYARIVDDPGQWIILDNCQLRVQIHDEEVRAEALDPPDASRDPAPFERSGPAVDVPLRNCVATTRDVTGWVYELGIVPIAFTVGEAIRGIPRVNEPSDHRLCC